MFLGTIISDLQNRVDALEGSHQNTSLEVRVTTLTTDLSNTKTTVSQNALSITSLKNRTDFLERRPAGSSFGNSATFKSLVSQVNTLRNANEQSNTWYD